ncbi:hypothetical protein Tco_0510521, partial [Tanacetum coccineum]
MSGLDALRYMREPTIPRNHVGSISFPPLSSSRSGRSVCQNHDFVEEAFVSRKTGEADIISFSEMEY